MINRYNVVVMERIPVSQVRRARQESAVAAFLKDKKLGDFQNRDSDAPYLVNRDADQYEELLPTFGGLTFTDHFLIRQNESQDPVSVLDIGCGEAKFIRELKEAHPATHVSGLSVTDLRNEDLGGIQTPWSDVDYRTGDMHRVERIFEDKKFDFVVSVWALFHSADPLDVVKQAYQLLKPDGIAFLQSPDIRITQQERDQLIQFWAQLGITVELQGDLDHLASTPNHTIEDIYNISFQRTTAPKLHMPFSYASGHTDEGPPPSIYRVNIKNESKS